MVICRVVEHEVREHEAKDYNGNKVLLHEYFCIRMEITEQVTGQKHETDQDVDEISRFCALRTIAGVGEQKHECIQQDQYREEENRASQVLAADRADHDYDAAHQKEKSDTEHHAKCDPQLGGDGDLALKRQGVGQTEVSGEESADVGKELFRGDPLDALRAAYEVQDVGAEEFADEDQDSLCAGKEKRRSFELAGVVSYQEKDPGVQKERCHKKDDHGNSGADTDDECQCRRKDGDHDRGLTDNKGSGRLFGGLAFLRGHGCFCLRKISLETQVNDRQREKEDDPVGIGTHVDTGHGKIVQRVFT